MTNDAQNTTVPNKKTLLHISGNNKDISNIDHSRESGSAIFYILIAIVLFAALSFAVSNSFRGSGEGMRDEIYDLQASEILQFARSIRSAAHGLRIDGIADRRISFENNFASGYTNSVCSLDRCKIFHPDGAGMTYSTPSEEWLNSAIAGTPYKEWYFSGANSVQDLGPSTNAELMLILPWLRVEMCTALNDALDITNPGGLPPQTAGNFDLVTQFTGTFNNNETISKNPELDNKRAACFEASGTPATGTYHFFQVLRSH